MVAAIDACRKSYKTACLTNNFASPDRVVSEEVAEVYALFDAVLESRVLGVRKPDPRFYELACATLGVEPEESVFLDDLGVNLKPARLLGMHTIKVTDPDEALAELARSARAPRRHGLSRSGPGAHALSGRRRGRRGTRAGEAAEQRAVPDGETAGVAERADPGRGAPGGEQPPDRRRP